MPQVKLSIAAEVFKGILEPLETGGFLDPRTRSGAKDLIGQIHLFGNWADPKSMPQRPERFTPSIETEMEHVEGQYDLFITLVSGTYRCIPVMVYSTMDGDDTVEGLYYECPEEGHGPFKRGEKGCWEFEVPKDEAVQAQNGSHGHWEFVKS